MIVSDTPENPPDTRSEPEEAAKIAMEPKRFRGVGPALVTPMGPDGAVDLDAFSTHVETVVEAGVHFLVPCGTTGESVTLTEDEQASVIRRCVQVADGAVPVMAGAGTNDTRHAVVLARAAVAAGADAVLSVSPYYNRPTQEGIFSHFEAVAQAVSVPIFIYNVPGRTGSNVEPETVLRLAAEVDNIEGVKEASGSMAQVMTLLRERPRGFTVLSGEDDLTFAMLSMGADGVISVAANEAPAGMAALCDHAFAGEWEASLAYHWRLLPIMRANFIESSPIPVKTAMEIMGRFDAHLRLPLVPMSEENRGRLEEALRASGLLSPSEGA